MLKSNHLWIHRSIAGGQTTSKEGPSRESSRGREPRDGTFKEPESVVPVGGIELTDDEMIKKTHAILDEYLHIQDIKVMFNLRKKLCSCSVKDKGVYSPQTKFGEY